MIKLTKHASQSDCSVEEIIISMATIVSKNKHYNSTAREFIRYNKKKKHKRWHRKIVSFKCKPEDHSVHACPQLLFVPGRVKRCRKSRKVSDNRKHLFANNSEGNDCDEKNCRKSNH